MRVKNHVPNDYRPYVKIDIKTLDPNGEVPKWDLTFGRTNPFSKEGGIKRQAEESPENQNIRKKRNAVPEWKIGEFLWMFLEGTKTTPDYCTEDVNLDDSDFTETINNEEEEAALAVSEEGDCNNDN